MIQQQPSQPDVIRIDDMAAESCSGEMPIDHSCAESDVKSYSKDHGGTRQVFGRLGKGCKFVMGAFWTLYSPRELRKTSNAFGETRW